MNEIYIIIQKIGDLESVVDKAYWYFTEADQKADELWKWDQSKGYTDFTYQVKKLELIGLK